MRAMLAVMALLVWGLGAPAGAGGGGPDPDVPVFMVADTGTHGVEVTLGVTSKGHMFFGGWDRIGRSFDGGRTWDSVLTGPIGSVSAADRVLVVDRATDRVFVDDAHVNCTNLAWSDDLGETWTENPAAACFGGITDHQKIAVGKRTTLPDPTGSYPNVVYVCSNALSHAQCAASPDGGLTWGPSVPTPGAICGLQGAPMAAPNGTLYQPRFCTTSEVFVEYSADNGVSWDTSTVIAGPGSAALNVPDLDFTPDGTGYLLWSRGDWRPYLARSDDDGRTWGDPLAVAPDLRSVMFPVVAAGGDGRLGVAFYGTVDSPAGWNGNPASAPSSVTWHLYAGTITEADTDAPTVRVVRVTDHPVQIGCLSKFGCSNTNIADYIDAEVTPAGRLAVAYVDGCPAACTSAAQSTARDGWVAVQTAGPLLVEG